MLIIYCSWRNIDKVRFVFYLEYFLEEGGIRYLVEEIQVEIMD